ncbi:FGGY family carbohydrate kinase [Thermococcus sp.]
MKYYLILDVGTTNLKAYAFSEDGEKLGVLSRRTKPLYPRHGWVELDPLELIEGVRRLIDDMISKLGKPAGAGITNQRSSTVVWDREGNPLYNMITWQDTRTGELVEELSSRFMVRFGRVLGKVFYSASKLIPGIASTRKGAYIISLAHVGFGTSHSSLQIRWLMDNVPGVKEAVERGEALFGTLDTWIVWNLTGRHVTDYTNASATGLFDPFYMKWSDNIAGIVGIPKRILPSVINNDTPAGSLRDYDVPLLTVVADQQASLYRAGVESGAMKMTHGTGTFIDINVGEKPKPAAPAIYPMVALKTERKTLHLLEGMVNASGSAVDWLISTGLMEDYSELKRVLEGEMHGDLIFIPAFAGLSTPYNRPEFKGALINITRGTCREDIIRALIMGLAMRCSEVISALERASGLNTESIMADGGLSQSEEFLQLISDLSGRRIVKPRELNGSAYGTFMIAKAVHEGKDIISAWKPPEVERVFEPQADHREFKRRWAEFLGKLI